MGITKTYPAPTFRFARGWGIPFAFFRFLERRNIRRGLWVVLLGPDGAGKSSVIAGIGDGVAAGFAGCDSYHLRPLSWRGRRRAEVNCDPHGQAARGALVTVLKLAYLFVVNWLGYLAVSSSAGGTRETGVV